MTPPAETPELIEAARRRLLQEDWDLLLVVTDLPLRVGGRPVSDRSSPTHKVAVVSLPALVGLHVRRRLHDQLVGLVGELLVEDEEDPEETRQRLTELVCEVPAAGRWFVVRTLAANLRLLGGMIVANRPWRFALRLYRVLVTALAVGVISLVSAETWQLSDALGVARLGSATLLSLIVIATALVAAHGLWERAPSPRVRVDVILFNVATTVTIVIGLLFLYIALFAVALGLGALLVPAGVIGGTLGHDVSVREYVDLAWTVASIASLGGALGAGLETDTTVRDAAYAGGDYEQEEEEEEEEAHK